MKPIHIHLTEAQYQKLSERSKLTGCSIASIIRNIITDNYLKNKEAE